MLGGLARNRRDSLGVVVSFLAGFDKLQRASDTTIRAALTKLRTRGLTDERIDEARHLIAAMSRPAKPAPERDKAVERRAVTLKAEAALWAYYVEWSQIARAVIKDERLLKLLGYGGAQLDDAGETETEPVSEPAVPAPSQPKKRFAPELHARKRTAKRNSTVGARRKGAAL